MSLTLSLESDSARGRRRTPQSAHAAGFEAQEQLPTAQSRQEATRQLGRQLVDCLISVFQRPDHLGHVACGRREAAASQLTSWQAHRADP
eukprot:s3378_g2.t1